MKRLMNDIRNLDLSERFQRVFIQPVRHSQRESERERAIHFHLSCESYLFK